MLEVQKKSFASHVRELQDRITQELLSLDPSIKLIEDPWTRKDFAGDEGGGGITRVFTGDLIENAGVNTSLIYGKVDPLFSQKIGGSGEVWATGISLIIHPRNPKAPTVHANFRLLSPGSEDYWFGGGADLTPFYPAEEDFHHFHQQWKEACSPYGCYEWMKKECDEYFVNHHRSSERGREMRGIGGIFFDNFRGPQKDIETDTQMVKHLSEYFIPSYFPILKKNIALPYDDEDEDFQLHRRGRYVEFNLLHDRGTLFGLKTNGRTDSIFVSLPARAKFTYCYAPKKGSAHEKMMEYYYPHNW